MRMDEFVYNCNIYGQTINCLFQIKFNIDKIYIDKVFM